METSEIDAAITQSFEIILKEKAIFQTEKSD